MVPVPIPQPAICVRRPPTRAREIVQLACLKLCEETLWDRLLSEQQLGPMACVFLNVCVSVDS